MPRDLTARTRTAADDVESNGGGLEQFAPRARGNADGPVSAGWSVDKQTHVTKGDRPAVFKVPEGGEEILLMFLQDKPFASFYQHWVKTEQGRRAYTCLGKGCPLCDRGDRPKPQDWFNVIEMGDEAALKVWYCSADPAKAIKARADNKRTSPINKDGLYWAASKKQASNGFNEYTVDPVKEEELQPDWGVVPLTKEQITAFEAKAYGPDRVNVPTKADLQEVADKYFQD